MATALELAGTDRERVEFDSVISLLAGKPGNRDTIYGAHTRLQRAVIQDGWKLILYPQAERARLYHVAADPLEMKDRAAEPTIIARKKALFAKLL